MRVLQCDELRPACSACIRSGRECIFEFAPGKSRQQAQKHFLEVELCSSQRSLQQCRLLLNALTWLPENEAQTLLRCLRREAMVNAPGDSPSRCIAGQPGGEGRPVKPQGKENTNHKDTAHSSANAQRTCLPHMQPSDLEERVSRMLRPSGSGMINISNHHGISPGSVTGSIDSECRLQPVGYRKGPDNMEASECGSYPPVAKQNPAASTCGSNARPCDPDIDPREDQARDLAGSSSPSRIQWKDTKTSFNSLSIADLIR